MLLRHGTTADVKAVIFLELLGLTDEVEHDQLVETLQEGRAQVLMQDVNVAQTKEL